jgi:hypothetical protein
MLLIDPFPTSAVRFCCGAQDRRALVRRDNIQHLVMVGGRNDVVIEPNIMHQPAPKLGRRPAPELKGLPPASAPTRQPPPKNTQHGLVELTRRLEARRRFEPVIANRAKRAAVLGAGGPHERRAKAGVL